MKAIGEASGAFKPVVSDDIAMYTPENIKQFDAIVLNNTSGPWITPTAADMAKPAMKKLGADAEEVEKVLRKSFLDFLEQGGGVVCLHFAIAANRQWPEFKELFGATFTGHPWTEEVGVTVEEPDHPLVAAFGGKDFLITDEIYQYGPPYDRSKLRVLMSIDPARTNMGPRWIDRKQTDFALTWVKPYGKGRIFNTSFGHMASLYSTPQVLQFYLDAIQFAAGDLEAPTAPRESRPVRKNVPGTQPAPGLEPGFFSLFDGKTLDGWDGDRTIWSVQDGAITGETKADTGLKENNFLIWKDQVENFELRLKFRLEGGNSGIYYRAQKRPARPDPGRSARGDPGRLRRLGPLDRRDHGVPAPRRVGRARPEGRDRRARQEAGRAAGRSGGIAQGRQTQGVERLHGGRQRRQRGAEDQRRDDVRIGRPRSQTPGPRLARRAGPRRPADARAVQGHLPAEAVQRVNRARTSCG